MARLVAVILTRDEAHNVDWCVLAVKPWVDAVETDHGRINVKLGNATIHQLTSFLISSGCVISGVIPQRRSLEDFFLKAIKR